MDNTPPAAPRVDEFSTASVLVCWDPVPGASFYELQQRILSPAGQNGGGGVSKEASAAEETAAAAAGPDNTEPIAFDTWTSVSRTLRSCAARKKTTVSKGLAPGARVEFRLRARDADGAESAFSVPSAPPYVVPSEEVFARRPAPPTQHRVPTVDSLTVTWAAIPGAAGYAVQYRRAGAVPPNAIGMGAHAARNGAGGDSL